MPCSEEDNRFAIDCNGTGVVVVAAITNTRLSELGDLSSPKLEFRQLVALLDEEGDEERDLEGQSPFVYTGYFPFGYYLLVFSNIQLNLLVNKFFSIIR